MRRPKKFKGLDPADERDSYLRSLGEDEMRRRIRDAEKRGILNKDPNRMYFFQEVQKIADYAKPANMRKIRENFGDREAEFRQGLAFEAMRFLRNPPIVPYKPTKEQAAEDARQTKEWLRKRGLIR